MVDRWSIHFCRLDPVQGSEQRGERPVLVVSCDAVNHSLPVSTVLPFSSVKAGTRIYPSEILMPAATTGLRKDSVAMVQQIRTLDHERFGAKVGELHDSGLQEEVKEALRVYFDI
jgi:mRNA interferase MazF